MGRSRVRFSLRRTSLGGDFSLSNKETTFVLKRGQRGVVDMVDDKWIRDVCATGVQELRKSTFVTKIFVNSTQLALDFSDVPPFLPKQTKPDSRSCMSKQVECSLHNRNFCHKLCVCEWSQYTERLELWCAAFYLQREEKDFHMKIKLRNLESRGRERGGGED